MSKFALTDNLAHACGCSFVLGLLFLKPVRVLDLVNKLCALILEDLRRGLDEITRSLVKMPPGCSDPNKRKYNSVICD